MDSTDTNKIPQGFKLTEIGAIPTDWNVYRLGEICSFYSGGTPNTSIKSYYGGDIKWITSSDLNKKVINDVEGRITKEGLDNSSAKIVEKGNLLLALYGATAGIPAITNINAAINQAVLAILPRKSNPSFLFHKFTYLKDWLINTFTQGGQPNLSGEIIKNIKFALPELSEQFEISKVLDDLDSLIQKTEKLIEKKRVIRKGLIHNLLSGTQRLHGFENNWVTEKLTELCWFQEGPGVRTSQFTNSGVKLLNGTNINKNQLNLDTTERYIPSKLANGAYAHFLADNDDIVIASSGISVEKFDEKVAFVEKKDLPLCMNTSTIRFKSYSNKMTKEYLFYFLQSDSFKKHIGEQATGSAQLNFGPYHLNRLSVHLPKDIDEQTAIAETLSFVDSEIHLLDKKLVKYNQIKQGAMQVLLTGKIRLNPNSYAKPITQSRAN